MDSDLAELNGVLTKNLNLAVRRNLRRFPEEFMFQVTEEEAFGRRYLPYVFTEQARVWDALTS